jgi:hypothetical protein
LIRRLSNEQAWRKLLLATFRWLCRGLYMTRVSDGFQLPLERDNVFQDYCAPIAETSPAKDRK